MCTKQEFSASTKVYKLHECTFEAVEDSKYLGVTFSKDLSWTTYVSNTAKASKSLGFLRQNMFNCTDRARERTCVLVLPVLIYAVLAWDPYLARDINSLG